MFHPKSPPTTWDSNVSLGLLTLVRPALKNTSLHAISYAYLDRRPPIKSWLRIALEGDQAKALLTCTSCSKSRNNCSSILGLLTRPTLTDTIVFSTLAQCVLIWLIQNEQHYFKGLKVWRPRFKERCPINTAARAAVGIKWLNASWTGGRRTVVTTVLIKKAEESAKNEHLTAAAFHSMQRPFREHCFNGVMCAQHPILFLSAALG